MAQVLSLMFIQRFTSIQMETEYLERCQEGSQRTMINDTLRAAIAHHIEDNSKRYKDFTVGNIEDYLSKMR